MPELAGDLELTVSSTAYRLVLKRAPTGELAYEEGEIDPNDPDALPDIPVKAEWLQGTPGGMGETFRLSPESVGYWFGQNTDASQYGIIRLPSRVYTSSATTATLADSPVFMFEDLDAGGANYIYCQVGQYVLKASFSGTAITIHEEKDLGSGALAGATIRWGNPSYTVRRFVPAGDAVNFWRLNTVATPPSTDTWAQDGALKAIAFTRRQVGANTQLDRFHTTNLSDSSSDGTTFGGDIEIGDTGSAITSAVDTGLTTFIAKSDNLWELPSSGIPRQLTRFQQGNRSSDYGVGLMAPSGSESCYYNHNGLYFWNGAGGRAEGPDANPLNQSVVGTTIIGGQPLQGKHQETAYASDDWVYSCYRLATSGNPSTYTGSAILAGRRGENGTTWYPIWTDTADVARGVIVDSDGVLWWLNVTDKTLNCMRLGPNGQPHNAGASKGVQGLDAVHYFPATDFGHPHVLKQLRSWEVRGKDFSAGARTLTLTHLADGVVSAITVASGVVPNPLSTSYWTTGTNDTAYWIWPYPTFVNTTLTTQDPRIYSMIIRASLRPAGAKKIRFTVTTKPYGDGSEQIHDPQQIRSALSSAELAAPVSNNFRDISGTQKTIYVTGVKARPVFVDTQIDHYEFDVTATIWVNA